MMKHVVFSIVSMFAIAIVGGAMADDAGPYTIVLGVAQDGGAPQAGSGEHAGGPEFKRLATSVAIVDPRSGKRWLLDCTPDFPEQLRALDREAPRSGTVIDGIFLTHAHMGHYTGLMYLGHEVMGAKDVPVYVMPRFREYLESNGPWDQLVRYENIKLRQIAAGEPVLLASDIKVTAFQVPHRQEYSEVVGYHVEGPNRSVLFIPDIDSWHEWDEQGASVEAWIERVDVAYLDGTFFDNGEIPGRDMSGFPHPFIAHSMERLAPLDAGTRSRVRFIHLNHTNPALLPDSEAARTVREKGFGLAAELERFEL